MFLKIKKKNKDIILNFRGKDETEGLREITVKEYQTKADTALLKIQIQHVYHGYNPLETPTAL